MGIYDSKSYTDFCFLFCVDMIKPQKFLSNFQGFIILIYLPFCHGKAISDTQYYL